MNNDHKDSLKLIGLHLLVFSISSSLFVASFRTPLFGNIQVLFYRGIALIALMSCLLVIGLLALKKTGFGSILMFRDIVLSVVAFSCIMMVFFTHIPVTIERSVSIFMLGYMNAHQGQILTKRDLRDAFVGSYVDGDDAMQKRLDEQVVSGNITRKGDGYALTPEGVRVVAIFSDIADVFGVDPKLIRQ